MLGETAELLANAGFAVAKNAADADASLTFSLDPVSDPLVPASRQLLRGTCRITRPPRSEPVLTFRSRVTVGKDLRKTQRRVLWQLTYATWMHRAVLMAGNR